MKYKYTFLLLLVSVLLSNCQIEVVNPSENNDNDSTAVYKNVTSNNLPNTLNGISRAVKAADVDNDGDLDLIIAVEGNANRILINNGNGDFSDETNERLPASAFNGRDVAVADFNQDGKLDLFFANLNLQADHLYINSGDGFFEQATNRIPNQLRTNTAVAYDFNQDNNPDLLLGNNGQNLIFINDGQGFFSNQSGPRLPPVSDVTYDLALADIDNDGNKDLLTANENFNRLYLNTGKGFFVNRTESRLPTFDTELETRDIELADIDDDGDLDIYVANVIPFQTGANAPDRLLVNTGNGFFVNATQSQLPYVGANTLDAEFIDIDRDGDLDILAGNFDGGMRVLINDGAGNFSDASKNFFPQKLAPQVIDFEIADFNGDGLLDIYIATFEESDLLLLRKDRIN